MVARRVLYVHLDPFFVSLEQARDSDLLCTSVIVNDGMSPRPHVASFSRCLRERGIRSGLPLNAAYRLCPEAVFLDPDWPYYQSNFERAVQVTCEFSPDTEPVPYDGIYVDVAGSKRLFGSEPQIAEQIRAGLTLNLGIDCAIGIGSGKLVAKIASLRAGQGEIVEVAQDGEADFLAPLSVDELPELDEKIRERLKSLGLKKVEQVAALTEVSLTRQFGRPGRVLYAWARGLDDQPLYPVQQMDTVELGATFDDLAGPDEVARGLRVVAEDVSGCLKERCLQGKLIILKLHLQDTPLFLRAFLKEPTDSADLIYEQAMRLFKNQCLERDKYQSASIGVSDFEKPKQLILLTGRASGAERARDVAVFLQRRYGGGVVKRAVVENGYVLAEHSFSWRDVS